MEDRATASYQATDRHATLDLLGVVSSPGSPFRDRFELYLRLRPLVRDAVVVLGPGSPLDGDHLRGLAGATEVARSQEGVALADIAAERLQARAAVSGRLRGFGRWFLVERPPGASGATRLHVVERGSVLFIADEAVLDELGVEIPEVAREVAGG